MQNPGANPYICTAWVAGNTPSFFAYERLGRSIFLLCAYTLRPNSADVCRFDPAYSLLNTPVKCLAATVGRGRLFPIRRRCYCLYRAMFSTSKVIKVNLIRRMLPLFLARPLYFAVLSSPGQISKKDGFVEIKLKDKISLVKCPMTMSRARRRMKWTTKGLCTPSTLTKTASIPVSANE